MNKINRRGFLKRSSVITAGTGLITVLPSNLWAGPVSPGDKVNIALIGCRKKGFDILKNHLDYKDTNCVAMCDVDRNILEERAAEIKKNYGFSPKLYGDFRKMLEQKDIDAVIVGTPDHWHCLNTVYSLQAGKDVYVEKPMANTIEECNIMTRAANYYGKIVQVGQQQRSNPIFIEVMRLIKNGTIGELRKVNLWATFNYGLGAVPVADAPVPEGVDYDMWLGPAPKRPFNENRFHGSWRHFWDYGGGMFSDWGVHLIDMGLWAKDQVVAPGRVMTFAANNSSFDRKRETFDTMNAIYPTNDYVINYDMIAGVERGPYDTKYGIRFIGDDGTITANRNRYQLVPEKDMESGKYLAEPLEDRSGSESHHLHVRNFLDCVKSRKAPVCTPEIGRVAAIHAHVANISARIGEPYLVWDDLNNRFTNSERANDYIAPEYRAPWKLPVIN